MNDAPTSAIAFTNGLFQKLEIEPRMDDSFLVQFSLGLGMVSGSLRVEPTYFGFEFIASVMSSMPSFDV